MVNIFDCTGAMFMSSCVFTHTKDVLYKLLPQNPSKHEWVFGMKFFLNSDVLNEIVFKNWYYCPQIKPLSAQSHQAEAKEWMLMLEC